MREIAASLKDSLKFVQPPTRAEKHIGASELFFVLLNQYVRCTANYQA